MRFFSLVLILLAVALTSFAQEEISGIINQYAVATGFDECSNELTISSSDGFEAGMQIIIIQMQGAEISTSNNSSFGDITSLGQAGKYEIAEINAITANGVILTNLPVNTYDFDGKVQVLSLPEYDSAIVEGTLTCAAWDGQTGGVLAIKVNGQLITDADIDVSGKGFRGGISNVSGNNNCNWLTNADNYSYDQDNWRGAPKGEGIAAILPGMEHGRGTQANGGGGGNDHNSGGGGGANVTSGGQGGENNEPSTFGCDGFYPGRGGKGISGASGRLFMGGGGGAGHENNGVGTNGANGGGIVIIIAEEFQGLGYTIKANGDHAIASTGDGAGGGGGAGSIVFIAPVASGFHFEAKGGGGGDADNDNADRCLGPGGGGSGGRILASSNITVNPLSISGGFAGMSFNSTACNDDTNGAANGFSGTLETQDEIPEGTEVFESPEIVSQTEVIFACTGDEVFVNVEISGANLSYQWQLDNGSGFTNINDTDAFSGTDTPLLQISPITELLNGTQLRLVISGNCSDELISAAIPVVVNPLPQAYFNFSTDNLTVSFQNNSIDADSYLWELGDGNFTEIENPEFTFSDFGTYEVTLIALNGCGQDTTSLEIALTAPVFVSFTFTEGEGCAPIEVQFTNTSTGVYNELSWDFPGGTPATSTEENPTIIYSEPGVYDVSLTASGNTGSNTFTAEGIIEILPPPEPLFTWQVVDGLIVSFSNNSEYAVNYNWTFGDGNTSTEENPVHEYAAPGNYEVTLNAQNIYCGVALSQDIMLVTDVNDPDQTQLKVFPNPVQERLCLESNSTIDFKIRITNMTGQVLFEKETLHNNYIDVSRFPTGIYFLQFENGNSSGQVKFIKK
ncbi:MAG: PKD domain-containing protein [Bacteroidetes bacterium]|nr:MAG: PKD domain-containing protein [Bacteroidota bacterium]